MSVGVSLVLVSHSDSLARGVQEVAGQMAPNVRILPAGGTDDNGIGTSFQRVVEAIALARGEDGRAVLLLSDLGSAAMLAESVIEGEEGVGHVEVPFVEGAVAAAVSAEGGGDLAGVIASARGSIDVFAPSVEEPASGPAAVPGEQADVGETVEVTLTVSNRLGLHARPAAIIAKIVGEYDAAVTIDDVDAASVLALMGLAVPAGAQVRVVAVGPQAGEVMKALVPQFEEGFGEE